MPTLAHPMPAPVVDVAQDLAARNTSRVAPRRRWFVRRQVQLLINLALVVLVTVSFISGWVASLLGLTEFGLHKYSSIALLLLATSHVTMHGRSLSAQLRNALGRGHQKPQPVMRPGE